jgi:hypothetical protein
MTRRYIPHIRFTITMEDRGQRSQVTTWCSGTEPLPPRPQNTTLVVTTPTACPHGTGLVHDQLLNRAGAASTCYQTQPLNQAKHIHSTHYRLSCCPRPPPPASSPYSGTELLQLWPPSLTLNTTTAMNSFNPRHSTVLTPTSPPGLPQCRGAADRCTVTPLVSQAPTVHAALFIAVHEARQARRLRRSCSAATARLPGTRRPWWRGLRGCS